MVATVEIDESNGAGETITDGITNGNYGSVDSANLAVATNAVTAGNNSFEKWWKLDFGGTFNTIDNLQIWKSAGNYVTGEGIDTNLRTSAYGGAESYVTPTETTSVIADQVMPVADPTSANLGISGSLAGSLSSAGKSDYMITQLQTTGATPAGDVNQKTFTFEYDEQ